MLSGQLGNVPALDKTGQVPLLPPLLHIGFIPIRRWPAQLMVEMGDGQFDVQFIGEGIQSVQQRHRIRPAGDGHQYPVSRLEHLVLVDCLHQFPLQFHPPLHNRSSPELLPPTSCLRSVGSVPRLSPNPTGETPTEPVIVAW